MWIKHNKGLYNTDDMSKIEVSKTRIRGIYKDGTAIILGSFNTEEEAKNIFSSITRSLVTDPAHPGVIIRDTKETKK